MGVEMGFGVGCAAVEMNVAQRVWRRSLPESPTLKHIETDPDSPLPESPIEDQDPDSPLIEKDKGEQ